MCIDLPSALIQSTIVLPSVTSIDIDLRPRCLSPDPNFNYRPVIGILTHPGDGASGRLDNASDASYIAASYVKFVEASGARVIPLIYNQPTEILFSKLSLVNGVIFTGGRVKSGLYYEVVDAIFKKILERNDDGEHFPLLAICLGFELITMIIAKDKSILQEFNAPYQPSTLDFINITNIEGTMFQRFPEKLLGKLSTDCIIMQNHHFGISPERLQGNEDLNNFFRIVTTCTDNDNKVYVSTVQGRNYPLTAVQWHPEKNAFEWGYQMIPHTEDAVEVTQNVANFLVSEARKSLNRPPSRLILDNLVYNYNSTYSGKDGWGLDEVYIFSRRLSAFPSREQSLPFTCLLAPHSFEPFMCEIMDI